MTAVNSMPIAENLARVRKQIAEAAEKAGRSPDEIRLVGVSKTFPAEAVIAAVQAGLADIGENRVQEAATKAPAVVEAGLRPNWHLVGHLQSNKAKAALDVFTTIHSVDSVHVAEALSRHARQPVSVLLEVNVAGEASKFGFRPEETLKAAERIARLPGLSLLGLMTVAPLVDDPEQIRPVFRTLRELRDVLGLRELSMGMSDDYHVAIGEGATMVRIGRAIFGARV